MNNKIFLYFFIIDFIFGVLFSVLIFGFSSAYLRVALFFRPIAIIPLMLLAFSLVKFAPNLNLRINPYYIFLIVVILGYFGTTVFLNLITFRNIDQWWLLDKLHTDLKIYLYAYGPYLIAWLITTYLHFFVLKTKST